MLAALTIAGASGCAHNSSNEFGCEGTVAMPVGQTVADAAELTKKKSDKEVTLSAIRTMIELRNAQSNTLTSDDRAKPGAVRPEKCTGQPNAFKQQEG